MARTDPSREPRKLRPIKSPRLGTSLRSYVVVRSERYDQCQSLTLPIADSTERQLLQTLWLGTAIGEGKVPEILYLAIDGTRDPVARYQRSLVQLGISASMCIMYSSPLSLCSIAEPQQHPRPLGDSSVT